MDKRLEKTAEYLRSIGYPSFADILCPPSTWVDRYRDLMNKLPHDLVNKSFLLNELPGFPASRFTTIKIVIQKFIEQEIAEAERAGVKKANEAAAEATKVAINTPPASPRNY